MADSLHPHYNETIESSLPYSTREGTKGSPFRLFAGQDFDQGHLFTSFQHDVAISVVDLDVQRHWQQYQKEQESLSCDLKDDESCPKQQPPLAPPAWLHDTLLVRSDHVVTKTTTSRAHMEADQVLLQRPGLAGLLMFGRTQDKLHQERQPSSRDAVHDDDPVTIANVEWYLPNGPYDDTLRRIPNSAIKSETSSSPAWGSTTSYLQSSVLQTKVPIRTGQELILLAPTLHATVAEQVEARELDMDGDLRKSPETTTTTTTTTPLSSSWVSLDWLQQHGHCLDMVLPVVSAAATAENRNLLHRRHGMHVQARRDVAAGESILPVPVVPIHRTHLEIHGVVEDADAKYQKPFWKGHQLLLNYCLATSSSGSNNKRLSSRNLLLFPYGPTIHHVALARTPEQANVQLQWSKQSNNDWQRLENSLTSLEELWNDTKSFSSRPPLLLELVAVKPITAGSEVVLYPGEAWNRAWENHVDGWQPRKLATLLQHNERSRSEQQSVKRPNPLLTAAEWDRENVLIVHDDEDRDIIPNNVQALCWINYHALIPNAAGSSSLDEEWWIWSDGMDIQDDEDNQQSFPKNAANLNAVRCKLLALIDVEKNLYGVELDQETYVTEVPRHAISFVDRPYTGMEFWKSAFRHEIELPSDLELPKRWTDLDDEKTESKCELFLAESGIPGAGLGIFTGKHYRQHERLPCVGDITLPIIDLWFHNRMRRYSQNNFRDIPNEQRGIISNYIWHGHTTLAHTESDTVWSFVPGVGALANFYPTLVNALLSAPVQTSDLHRGKDPGAGASSTYHNTQFVAKQDIQAGEGKLMEQCQITGF